LGFDIGVIRIQAGIHNKGIVVDSKTVMVGSHNWSGAGSASNRDASLIFDHEKIAHYFEKIFVHDWTHFTRAYVHKPPRVRFATPGEPTPAGFECMTLSQIIGS
jgi:phosphatidylserine/phosphatidylglycerophosphate/cardiolipin synthase-like enzyme